MSTIDKLVLDSDTSDAFIRRLMSSVVLATKESNALPQGSDYQYHAISPEFRDSTKNASTEAKSLIQQICEYVKPHESFKMSDDMSDSAFYEQIVDVIDALLEGADQCLDQSKPKASNVANTVNQSLSLDKDRLLTQANKNIPKPQLDFYTTIDNMRGTPFRPRVTTKYHAIAALDDRPRRLEVSAEDDELVGTVGPDEYFPHPYEAELRALKYPSWCADGKDVKHVSPTPTYSQTAFKYVDNDSDFEKMLRGLSGATELAVDLEHHSYYTFLGLTCLMQISTRKQDFIVDTLALRRRMPELGVVFADPKVVKVLHGCDKDVLWLQRDLGLYLVNCFDTHVAAKALSYPALSLAHLLKMHCGVTADKKHQLSDWRLRPLSPEMLHYAKEDTHYLLYVFDRMRQELWMKLGQAGVEQVFSASKQLCLARYEKPRFNPLGYKDLFRETASSRSIPKLEELSSLQDAALCSLWDWRDRMARDEDDSCAALVSNAELLRIGVHLPQTGVQLEQLCGPLSPFTRKHTADILRIVSEATSFGPSGGAIKASSDTDVDTFASPSSKKAKSAASMPPTDGAAPKSVVPVSVYTFTPAVVTPKVISGRLPSASELLSPVLRTDEIFKQAGWNTPKVKNEFDTSPQFDVWNCRPSISEENRQRMVRSQEELVVEFENQLKKLATRAADAKESAKETASKAGTRGPAPASSNSDEEGGKTKQVDVGGVALEIPKSFEEVYQLSQRNRQRNKDKRRAQGAHAGEDDAEDMEDGAGVMEDGAVDNEEDTSFTLKSGLHRMPNKEMAAGGGKKVDASFYLSGSDQPMDTGVDGTLELAQTLGWVRGAAEAAAVRDAHFQDLSHQQAAIDSGGAGSSADDSSTGMRSERTAGSGGRKSRDNARPGKSTSGQQSGEAGRLSGEGIAALSQDGNKSRAPIKAFDYSKLPHTGMGALATNSTGPREDGKKGGKQQKGGNKNRSSGDAGSNPSLNPYMFGATLGK